MLMNILRRNSNRASRIYTFSMNDTDSAIFNNELSWGNCYDSVYLGCNIYNDDCLSKLTDIGKYIVNCINLIPGIMSFNLKIYQYNPSEYELRLYLEDTFSFEVVDEFITMFNENSINDYYNFIKFYNSNLITTNVLKYQMYDGHIFNLFFPKIILNNCCSLHSVKLRNNSLIYYRYSDYIRQNFIKRKYLKLVKRLVREYCDIAEINIFKNRIMMNFFNNVSFPNLRRDVILEVVSHSLNHQYILNEI